MALVLNQNKLHAHAMQNEYIIPAFNCFDSDSMKAILDAAEKEDSPVVLQICMAMHHKTTSVEKFMKYCMNCAADYSVPVIINHDHMQKVDDCKAAVNAGFPSVMFDGSNLSFEENVLKTKEIANYAHEHGTWVEAELGSIPGFEDDVFSEKSKYTDPVQAARFIDLTQCDSLSVAVGTAHGGVKADGPLEIDFELLKMIKIAVGETPLVLHGAASLSKEYIDDVNAYGGDVEYLRMCGEETIEKTRHFGVTKANMDVDNFLRYTYVIRKVFQEEPGLFNPFEYNAMASEGMKEACAHKMKFVTKSSGYGSLFYASLEH